MKISKAARILLCGSLALTSVITAQQLETPLDVSLPEPQAQRQNQDDNYEAPILQGGLGVVQDENSAPRRRYPERSYQNNNQGSNFNQPQRDYVDPGSAFRQPPGGGGSYDPYPPTPGRDYPLTNRSNSYTVVRTTPQPVTRRPTPAARTSTTQRSGPTPKTTRDPFDDPNRYRGPQQHEVRDGVRFVNGRPYRYDMVYD